MGRRSSRSIRSSNGNLGKVLIFFWGVAVVVEVVPVGVPFFSGQSLLICPGFLHLKHNPFFMKSVRSSAVIALMLCVIESTSIAFGSFLGLKVHFPVGLASSFLAVSLFKIRCKRWKLLSNFNAHLYQSSRVMGGSAKSIIFLTNGVRIDFWKIVQRCWGLLIDPRVG